MLKVCFRAASVLLTIGISSLITACQPSTDNHDASGTGNAPVAREVANALDQNTAAARKDRISDVGYELFVDVYDSAEWFSGEVRIGFKLTDPSTDLTIDFGGGTVHQLRVNDQPVRIDYNGFFLTLPSATLRSGENVISVEFEHGYDEDGTGLHRFVDPADDLTYLYTYLWPYYANRLFPLFDQPNLKAEISLTVRAPESWVVVSTGTATAETTNDGSALWHFTTTPRISSYAFSLHAGPYKVWEGDADGIPIRLMARRSLAEFVAVDEWLETTRRGLAFYGDYFDIPYPFGKYDQLIVPDFNIGAMENIAAVTFAERYVQRQQSDRAQRERRTSVILHEMAHMWFGNLVTHEWWNGLWLNESFATQMSMLASVATTEFTDTWHGFLINNKRAAYARDSRVTTHPIEMPVNSTADFFTVFDAITYQKGSSSLKQLAHYVGEENYQHGVSAYLKENAYDTTDLQDFIGHQEKSAAIDLGDWTNEWLYKPGFNTLSASVECNNDGLQSLTIVQTAPDDHPYLRHHRLDVALYNLGENGGLLPGEVFSLEIAGAATLVDIPQNLPCPAMINPNQNDWAYARIALDDRTVAALEGQLANVPEPLTRSIFLAALLDMAMAGEMPLASYIGHAMRLADRESNIRIQQQISSSIIDTVGLMQRLRPETDDALAVLLPRIEKWTLRHASDAASGDLTRIWFNTFAGVVSTDPGLGTVTALLQGTAEIEGLPISADIRWMLLTILSRHGVEGIDALLAAESKADVSDFGAKSLLMAQAAIPDKVVKSGWLAELRNPEVLTGLARQRAVMAGLFPSNQTALQVEVLDQVLDALPDISDSRDPYFISSYASVLLSPMCVEESSFLMQDALDRYADQLNSTALRFLQEALQADRECFALRGAQ